MLRGLTLWPESPSLLALYGDLLSEGGMHDAAQNFFDRAQVAFFSNSLHVRHAMSGAEVACGAGRL